MGGHIPYPNSGPTVDSGGGGFDNLLWRSLPAPLAVMYILGVVDGDLVLAECYGVDSVKYFVPHFEVIDVVCQGLLDLSRLLGEAFSIFVAGL